MNIISKNLNLLPIIVAIGDEGSLTRAALRLNLSQPALSHALQRLREEFDDPLFVRESHGLLPTPTCEQLIRTCRPLLTQLEGLYALKQEFDLKRLTRDVTLATTTYFELRILEGLFKRLQSEAPGIVLATESLQGALPLRDLAEGRMDLAIAAYFDALPPSIRSRNLGSDKIVCLTHGQHPLGRARDRLKVYLQHRHVIISVPLRASQAIDLELEKIGRAREPAALINNFLTPPLLLADKTSIITCPESLAKRYAEWFDLKIHPTPVPVPDLSIKMIWHERYQADPFHRYLRNTIVELSKVSNPA